MKTLAEIGELVVVPAPRPDLAAAPGQFFLAVPPTLDTYLPRAVFPFRIVGENVESLLATRQVAGWFEGPLSLRGPYGKGFTLAAPLSRALLVAQDPSGSAHLIALVNRLLARECEVAVLCPQNEWMERWLPAEIEYHEPDDLQPAVAELLSWPDALYAVGSADFYSELRATALQRRIALQRGGAQLLVRDLPMPCGVGICYVCAFRVSGRVVLSCQDGPVFDLADWVVEE